MKYIRLIKKILFIIIGQFDGLWDKIVVATANTKEWKCFHCEEGWSQSFENEYLCAKCQIKHKEAFTRTEPKKHMSSWRGKLAHLPGEIEAIEAGIYEDKEANIIIDNSGA